jgi:hypothetical protein
MTLISWNGTGPILKNGSIGTQSACCCDAPPPPDPECSCNCAEGGFDFCDFSESIDFSDENTCPGQGWPFQNDLPCASLELGDFEDVQLYFGTTAQGYPFSRQWLKDEAVDIYDNETCSFAIHACQKIRYTHSRCMRDGVCICANHNGVTTRDYHVWFFDCNAEAWIDVTDDILTQNREVGFSDAVPLGPENGCFDCEWDNGNPPPPPADPGPCDYDITTGPCEDILGGFP